MVKGKGLGIAFGGWSVMLAVGGVSRRQFYSRGQYQVQCFMAVQYDGQSFDSDPLGLDPSPTFHASV